MSENRLVEIPVKDWPKLRDLYETRKCESVSYNMIQNYIDWLAIDPTIDFLKFYSLNGDWSDGTFLLQDSYLILFDVLDPNGEDSSSRLFEALCLLDYSYLRVFNGYDSRLQSVVAKVIERMNLNDSHRLNGSYDLFVLRQDIAVGLTERQPPKGITFAPLKESHTESIDKIWFFKHEGSQNATQELIKYGRSLGAYTTDGQLVAWIIVQQTGALGFVKVHDDYRRLGIASILITKLAREIAATGQDVMTLTAQDNEIDCIMVNTRGDPQDRLFTALQCLDPKASYLFAGFHDRLRPSIVRYLSDLGLKVDSTIMDTTIWHHISREDALKFNTDPPEGITISPLTANDIHTINDIWPHRYPESDKFIGRLIAFNTTVGAYDKEGNLIAWCLKLAIGAIGVLHVKDEHKRKGFGSLLVRIISKKLAQMNIEVVAPVVEHNVASRSMFQKLGFQEIDKVYWLHKPAIE